MFKVGTVEGMRPGTSQRGRNVISVLVLTTVFACSAMAEDVIEFLSGARATGTVSRIDKTGKKVTLDATIAGKKYTRVYNYSDIHAVTYQGKRYVLNEKSSAEGSAGKSAEGAPVLRTKAQVQKLIEEVGQTTPDWFGDTPVEHPKPLDLTWPEPAPAPWNNQKNMGQYIWDIINPNPGRWRSGIRLMYHLLELHEGNPQLRRRCALSLAGMYFRFFQDYVRAAYWWQQCGVSQGDPDSVALAECYWRLGNKQLAVDMLQSRSVRGDMVKLWGDMGDTAKALQLAELLVPAYARQGVTAGEVLMHAGDACRKAGRYKEALAWYQKVLDEPTGLKGRVEQCRNRAQSSIDAIRWFELSDVSQVDSGTYSASSLGYEGDIKVEVVVKDHRIESVRVVQHKEKQFYSALTDIPQQIIQKQGVKGVDATSRATITAEAILNATAKAIAGQSN